MSLLRTHELVVIGGGPAGLSAAIYATRAGFTPVVIESGSFGGQISTTDELDNYPGLDNVGGVELGERMRAHAERLGAEFSYDAIKSIEFDAGTATFRLQGEESYEASAVVYAAGASPRKAGFVGENAYLGRGVSYCATCDGMFYRGKQVFVVGGGNTACEEATYLARLAEKVTLLVRKDHLRAMSSLANSVVENPKIEVRYLTSIVELRGREGAVTSLPDTIVLSVGEAGATPHIEELSFAPGSFGVFVAVGREPRSELISDLVDLDADGYVLTNDSMETCTPGLFCAGDVRTKPLRQVVTAASDGAVAAVSAATYLSRL